MTWLSIVVPGMLFVVWQYPATRRPKIWMVVLGIAVLVLVGLVGNDLRGYFALGGKGQDGFKRALFAVVQMTSFPIVALVVGSAAAWIFSIVYRRKNASKDLAAPEKNGLDENAAAELS